MRISQIGTVPLCFILISAAFLLFVPANAASTLPTDAVPSKPPQTIGWSEIGAKAGADYKGDALSVTGTETGAQLRCVFQQLEGEATAEGLWLKSTVTNTVTERFRVVASSVGRRAQGMQALPRTGSVSSDGKAVRFIRDGLVEEYTVSMDGVRQDFIIEQKPAGEGELRVELAVTGARVQPTGYGAQLVLEKSGRKIAYSRLHVSDANGKELPARMEVSDSLLTSAATGLVVVVVADAEGVYPIRIDPTFSDANWVGMGGIPGANSSVFAAVTDGSGNLYIGGSFTVVGDVIANYIAKWNGSSWSALGSGMNHHVYALAIKDGDLYAGGASGRVSKWNGAAWNAVGGGMNNSVRALAVLGNDLYAAGDFTTPGSRIAKWNGSSWSQVSSGVDGLPGQCTVYALAASGGLMYVGGNFLVAGGVFGVFATNIAVWDGLSWSAVGSGINGTVYALAASGSNVFGPGNVYAGGSFTKAGGIGATNVAKWDGTNWSALGVVNTPGAFQGHGTVYALAVSGSDVYAGGEFSAAGGYPARNVAKWDGSIWSELSPGARPIYGGLVRAFAMSGTNLYAGGDFTIAGWVPAKRIALWNGSNWSALGSGISGEVYTLAVSGSNVYAGGWFASMHIPSQDINEAPWVGKWNGSSWTTLNLEMGMELGGRVHALAVLGSDLYAGGRFSKIGGILASGVAKLNGTNWSPLGSGVGGFVSTRSVNALAVSGNDLYAAGSFTNAGGNSANAVAKWDGTNWSSLGSGVNGPVNALAVSGNDLYAAGSFTMAGENPAINIAKWNGSSWSPLGSGLSGGVGTVTVHTLAISGGSVYAGGFFTNAGGVKVGNIAKWNGSAWSALGSGVSGVQSFPYRGGSVYALAVSGSELYVGGFFTNAGGIAVSNIAKWNGSSWSALGSGMDYDVRALHVSGSQLYAGGLFTIAGGKAAGYTASAYLERPTLSIVRSSGDATVSWPTFYSTYVLQQNPDPANTNTWNAANYAVSTNGTIKSIQAPITPTNQFFRLIGN